MSEQLESLRQRLAQLADLRHASNLANWDQQTMMPQRGAPARAEALATLERMSHEIFVSAETGRLLDGAAAELSGAAYESDDACLVRLTRRQWEKARRVPADLAAELARAASIGQEAWVAARRTSDFAAFAPYLERNFELARRYVDCHLGRRRLRVCLRRAARRLRAGDADQRRGGAVRRAEVRARAADRRGRPPGRTPDDRRSSTAGPGRASARAGRRRGGDDGLRARGVAHG